MTSLPAAAALLPDRPDVKTGFKMRTEILLHPCSGLLAAH
jgi:hypothetical protein